MDPVSAVLIAMFAAGYFTRNTVQDMAWKARGEDPPSYRREQDRIARRQARRPLTERREARKFWVNAWEDAWESAEERRARTHAKRAERRHHKWQADDVAAAEDEAHDLNRYVDAGTGSDVEDDADRAARCGWCPTRLGEGQAREVVLQGVPITVCPDCYQRHQDELAERQDAARWPRCADCGRPTSAPEEDVRDGRPVTVCRTCRREESPQSAQQSAQAAGTSGLCPHCVAQMTYPNGFTSPFEVVHEPHCPRKDTPAHRAEEADGSADAGGDRQGPDHKEDQDHDQHNQDGQDGAKIIQFSAWTRPAPDAGDPTSTNPINTSNEEIQMSGESTNLTAAIGFTQGMATQADQAVNEIEMSIAGLESGGVTGPAVAALQQAMEALNQAAAAFRSANTELNSHMSVRDAYHANQGAGTREFVTQD